MDRLVITLHQKRFPDWVLDNWLRLEEALNKGYKIERVDVLPGCSGWSGIRNGALVYILKKEHEHDL